MIFHSMRSITIGDFSEMITAKDKNMVKRVNFWVPKWMINKAYSNLITEYNKNTNEKEVNEILEADKHKLSLMIKINLQFTSLLKLIEMAEKLKLLGYDEEFEKVNEKLIEVYKIVYGREPNEGYDYKKVKRDRELSIKRYRQMYPNKKEEDNKQIDFEEVIVKTELVLAPLTIREKKLYTLNRYLAMAALKMKNNG